MRASRLRRSDLLLPALLGVVGGVEIAVAGYDPIALAVTTATSTASREYSIAIGQIT